MRDLASGTTDEREETLRRQAAELERLRAEVAAWRKRYEKGEKRDIAFNNSEGEVEPLYTALDTAGEAAPDDSLPGAYPFTRGIHPTGYRG
jgi:methylmalonyl-CoA mutase N-terminal domain/subunit